MKTNTNINMLEALRAGSGTARRIGKGGIYGALAAEPLAAELCKCRAFEVGGASGARSVHWRRAASSLIRGAFGSSFPGVAGCPGGLLRVRVGHSGLVNGPGLPGLTTVSAFAPAITLATDSAETASQLALTLALAALVGLAAVALTCAFRGRR